MTFVPESVCEGFFLKISFGIRFFIIISSSYHHHIIIISSSYQHHIIISSSYHHHIIIISSSYHHYHFFFFFLFFSLSLFFCLLSSLPLSFSLFYLFFLKRNTVAAKIARGATFCGNPGFECQKLRASCDFRMLGATICGNPALECQNLRFFAIFAFPSVLGQPDDLTFDMSLVLRQHYGVGVGGRAGMGWYHSCEF